MQAGHPPADLAGVNILSRCNNFRGYHFKRPNI